MADDFIGFQFQIPGHPYSVIRAPLTPEWVTEAVRVARELADALDAAFPPRDEPEPVHEQPQQRAQGGGRPQNRGGQGRADRFAETDGACDLCGGPVGIYPRTGNMRSDKIVCLGKCMDGQYVHTVGWVQDEPAGERRRPVGAGNRRSFGGGDGSYEPQDAPPIDDQDF